MAKANTKSELITAANDNYNKMWEIINSLSPQEVNQNFTYDANALTEKDQAAHWLRDKNIRDVLIHLYEWHNLLIDWITTNLKGEPKTFLPSPYTWANYQQMNNEFFQKHQNTPYQLAKQLLEDTHYKVLGLIEKFNDSDLFTKKHFKWANTTSVGQYFHSVTTAHYLWAIKKLKAYQKSLKI